MRLSPTKVADFQKTILDFYREHGRHTLPWRTHDTSPYHIMVSEIMLQQTQVERVIPKFLEFVAAYPTAAALAKAPQSDVIRHWVGLGYNRRARFLHLAAREIVDKYGGELPRTLEEITTLPGIGPYTGAAILAFAYNLPLPVIETNIRTVYIHHFFGAKSAVKDKDILSLVEVTMDRDNPRRWYSALMDYGTYLKATVGNLTRQSKSYAKQSKFEGSTRQLRGAILRVLATAPLTPSILYKQLNTSPKKLDLIITQLKKEQLITEIKSGLLQLEREGQVPVQLGVRNS